MGSASDAGGVGGQRYFGDGLFSQFISLKLAAGPMQGLNHIFRHEGFEAALCVSERALEEAGQLRYRAYRAAGLIPQGSSTTLRDAHDLESHARTHLLLRDGVPVASVRSSVWCQRYGWRPTEAHRLYPAELEQHVGPKGAFLESNRFVIDPDLDRKSSALAQLLLFRIQDLSAVEDACDVVVTLVRKMHAPFYRRMLGFEQLAEPRSVDWLESEVVLLATTQSRSREVVTRKGMPPCTDEERERYAASCRDWRASRES